MDSNNLTMGAFPMGGLPMGLGMALAMNENSAKEFENLTETEKEHLIMQCKDARSEEEMQKIVNSMSSKI